MAALPTTAQAEPTELEQLQEYAATLEEALSSTEGVDYGGGAWVDMWGLVNGHPVKINVTSHAHSPEGGLRNLMRAIKIGMDEFHLTPYQPGSQPAPAPAPAAASATRAPAPVPGAVPAPAPAPVAAPAPTAATNANTVVAGATGTYICEKVTVLPRPDGKSDILFWCANRKFAEIKMTKSADDAAAMFVTGTGGAWTAAHFAAAGQFVTPIKVTWVASTRTKANGEPYKDVVKVENV